LASQASVITVAILAQGTHWATAVKKAYCPGSIPGAVFHAILLLHANLPPQACLLDSRQLPPCHCNFVAAAAIAAIPASIDADDVLTNNLPNCLRQ